jgi:hypothetical protein
MKTALFFLISLGCASSFRFLVQHGYLELAFLLIPVNFGFLVLSQKLPPR